MKDNVIKVPMVDVQAANIEQIGHHAKEQILAVKFLNGTLYYYLDIPREHYEKMLVAPSIGSYMHRNIKGNFRYTRIHLRDKGW